MKNPWVGMAFGVALGAVAVFFYSSARQPRVGMLSPLPEPYYTVLFENDYVRLVEHRLDPGEREPMHDHPPMVVYFMEDANVRITGPDGSMFDEFLTKGRVAEIAAQSHSIENLGHTPLHSLLVELKTDASRD